VTPLRGSVVSPTSEAQRRKVAGRPCLVCGRRPVDAAHLVPRSLGGCDEPDCVVPLCRRCHRAYDDGELDLLPHLEPGYRVELAHALRHLSLLALLRRVTGVRWVALDRGRDEDARRAA
jgi:5-methylcytosine-specific restriction endonuclease McrA